MHIGTTKDNSYLLENYCDETEIKAVIFIDSDFWIFITNNEKGIFRFDDGCNSHYTDSFQDALLMLEKFFLDNK